MSAVIGKPAFLDYDLPKIKHASLGLSVKEKYAPSIRSLQRFFCPLRNVTFDTFRRRIRIR